MAFLPALASFQYRRAARRRLTAAAALAWLALVGFSPALAQDTAPAAEPPRPRPAPLFTGKEFPRPPEAGREWTPPAGTSERTASALKQLLAYGLADPRGCEYREAEAAVGYRAQTIHAWVLPLEAGSPPDAPRFAISWNGQIVSVMKIGESRDWRADAETLASPAPRDPQKPAPTFAPNDLTGWSIGPNVHQPIRSALALLLGEPDLAEKLWQQGQVYQRNTATRGTLQETDPFQIWAIAWAWINFDRALDARSRGDDALALLDLKASVATRDGVAAEAPKRGWQRRKGIDGQLAPYITFLDQLDALVADQERRVAAGPIVRVLDPNAPPIADQAARIKALIRDFEAIQEQQLSQPGGVSLGASPIVSAVVKEGDAAIEPLLDCLQNDKRLTRSYEFGRSFFAARYVLPANRAAQAAIEQILKTREFGYVRDPNATPEQASQAYIDAIRETWKRGRGISEVDRWFNTLADEKADVKQWTEAAANIVRREPRPYDAPVNPMEVRPYRGEPLREKKNPSVSDLLAQRSDDAAARQTRLVYQPSELYAGCSLAIVLAKWDGPAAVPVLKRRAARLAELDAAYVGDVYVRLVMIGVDLGGEELLDSYITWLGRLKPDRVSEIVDVLRPLSRYSDRPKIVALSESLFAKGSPWRPAESDSRLSWSEVARSPLVSIDPLRAALVEAFEDQTPVGKVVVDLKTASTITTAPKFDNSRGSLGHVHSPGEVLDGQEQTYRVCDHLASRFVGLTGAPLFERYWPEGQRSAAITDLQQFVYQWGPAFHDRENLLADSYSFRAAPKFYLPPLDRPATEADVAAARAIFSLQNPGAEVRVVKLDQFPHRARWKTLKDFVLRATQPSGSPANADRDPPQYEQQGRIWQAEEILVDGKWKRYYGFVGAHIISQVPAEEIDLLDESDRSE